MLSTYLARAGEEDAIIALYEDWHRTQFPKVKGGVSGELLRSVEDPRQFVSIIHYESRESALALTSDPEQHAWLQRLASLAEQAPVLSEYKCEWQIR